jgi:hypothetical protein
VQVTAEQSWTGRYVIRGRILGVIPWQGPFRYVLHEWGFHSQDAVSQRGGLHVNGGFTAEPDGDRTRIWHYVRWTQRREMRDLVGLIERNEEPAPATADPDQRSPRRGEQ